MPRPSPIDRFMSFVNPAESGCMEWTGGRDWDGYGMFYLKGKTIRAARAVWTLTYGEIPKGMIVCHRCDNPPCVNLDHLFLGTYSDNTRDSVAKNRFQMGERHHQGKLTDAKVREIRISRADGKSIKCIAERFGVAQSLVWAVANNRIWRHVVDSPRQEA